MARHELDWCESIAGVYGDSFARFLTRCEAPAEHSDGGDHHPEFWTVDRWLTHLNLHPAEAPFGVWSLEPTRRGRRKVAA